MSPLVLLYGTVVTGSTTGKKVTVSNAGTAPLVLGTIKVGGLNPEQFMVVAARNLCAGRTLAAGQSCTVAVRFTPTTAGLKTAKLRIPSNDPDKATLSMNLKGTADDTVALPRDRASSR